MGDRNKIGNFDTSGLGVRDPDFWKQLVEHYKMYYTLFSKKKLPKLFLPITKSYISMRISMLASVPVWRNMQRKGLINYSFSYYY